ncbi:MAG TPA: hypothetical protein VLB69_07595 [Rudaea sp.]|nr:hypothetical protein [Rudaea sp.]
MSAALYLLLMRCGCSWKIVDEGGQRSARQDGGAVKQGQGEVKRSLKARRIQRTYPVPLLRSQRRVRGAAVHSHERRRIMRKIPFGIIAFALISPAWAAGHGGGGSGHGAAVSAAAQSAHMSGSPVGASVRDVARSQSQGAAHANANAITHVQNSPGMANANSVLGSGATTATTTTSPRMTTAARGHGSTARTAKSGKVRGKGGQIH